MSTQSEAALEAGLIATLRQMDYDYVQIVEEDNLYANFKRQLEIHNRKRLEEHGRTGFAAEEFEKILIYLEGGTRKYSVITRLRFMDCLIISNCLSYPTVLILAILPIIQIVGISSHSPGQMLSIIRSMNWISLPYSSWKNVRLAKS